MTIKKWGRHLAGIACLAALLPGAVAAPVPETATLKATADSYVETNSYNGYGRIVYFMVGQAKTGILRFDLSSLQDREILGATMQVHAQKPYSNSFSVRHLVDNGWAEYVLGWFNRPYNIISTQGSLSTVASSGGGWASVDVTNAVSLTAGRPMSLQIDGTNPVAIWFDTRESVNPPTLTVTRTATPIRPARTQPSPQR